MGLSPKDLYTGHSKSTEKSGQFEHEKGCSLLILRKILYEHLFNDYNTACISYVVIYNTDQHICTSTYMNTCSSKMCMYVYSLTNTIIQYLRAQSFHWYAYNIYYMLHI